MINISPTFILEDALEAPFVFLCAFEDLATLFCELWLATFIGDLSEEDGHERFICALPLSRLLPLFLLELYLDVCGFGELLR